MFPLFSKNADKFRSLFSRLEAAESSNLIHAEQQKLLMGQTLSMQMRNGSEIKNLHEAEFRVFSQFGDDGIIQWLISTVEFPHKTFIEFGVENYREATTRFLMMNNNWAGLVMDGSDDNVMAIRNSEYYWKFDLRAAQSFVTAENVNDSLAKAAFSRDVGILHIDIDGNDFWVWKAIEVVRPCVVIVEFNSVFGNERAITVPYHPGFTRTKAHSSNLYFGASLPAFNHLARDKGYRFIGCNSAGNNAYFLRDDKVTPRIPTPTPTQGYVASKFRESRDPSGQLTFLTGRERLLEIAGMPVINVISGEIENL